jgi:hypothetical protein
VPTYDVVLHLGFDRRPGPDEQAFLGPLSVRVQPWGATDLQVSLQVPAPDIGAAVAGATRLVDRLGGEPQAAQVALAGARTQRTGLWETLRRRLS